jgi:hypothetical protein
VLFGELEVGRWDLGVGSWKLEVGSWNLSHSSHPAVTAEPFQAK